MIDPLRLHTAAVVVELGCGTGVITRALLDLLPSQATLIAFEINPRFVRYLRNSISDPRLVLVNSSAEESARCLRELGCGRVDAVASSVPLGYLPEQRRRLLLDEMMPLLNENGVLTQYQYIHGLQFKEGRLCRFDPVNLLHRYFASIERSTTWLNLPPAFVYVCKRTLSAAQLSDRALEAL